MAEFQAVASAILKNFKNNICPVPSPETMSIEPKAGKYCHLSKTKKLRILEEVEVTGYKPTEICRLLKNRGHKLQKSTVSRFYRNYKSSGSIERKLGSGRPRKVTPAVLGFVQQEMDANDEMTGKGLKETLDLQCEGMEISDRSLLRARQLIGWDYKSTQYCQMIRQGNVEKRYLWACQMLKTIQKGHSFSDIIFTDELKIDLEIYRRKTCRRKGQLIKRKGKHKHPVSVLVWAGISERGRTALKIFKGIMDADFYVKILKDCLLPFATKTYGAGKWKLMQDNGKYRYRRRSLPFFVAR